MELALPSLRLSVQRIVENLVSCAHACTSNFFVGEHGALPFRCAPSWDAFNRHELFNQLCRHRWEKTLHCRRTRDHCCVDDGCRSRKGTPRWRPCSWFLSRQPGLQNDYCYSFHGKALGNRTPDRK